MKELRIEDHHHMVEAAAADLVVYEPGLKRAFDVVVAILLLVPVLPVIAVLYLLTRRDGGDGFFGHARVGLRGRTFKCWKIRTMVPNAQQILQDHLRENPEAALEWSRDFKLASDPRITRLGRILRKTSLDELPQIWNVMKGEMSFVGPRPVTREELYKYGSAVGAYLSCKPGITGLWQVSGRNDVDYDSRVQLDLDYMKQRSLFLDIRIMFMTVGAVLNRTGK